MGVDPISAVTGRFHEDLGMWVRVAMRPRPEPRPALFLDRDGVIVEDPGYLSRAADLSILPGAADLIALANLHDIPVVEVSNQAGIGRGYYGWREFSEVEEALARALASTGAVVDAVFACPYHNDGVDGWIHAAHPARKPEPGMLLAAKRFLHLDLKHSWIVGDKLADLQAGYNAGLRGGLHVLTGHGAAHRLAAAEWKHPTFDLRLGNSIADAAVLLELLAP